MPPAAILDIDGTLVDTNYQHVIAWSRALKGEGAEVPLWKIHRHIGMGGDQLVAAVAGEEFDERSGDAAREAEKEHYADLVDEVELLDGATDLLSELESRGIEIVLASSAKEEEVERYLDMLGARERVKWTTSADVDNTKPDPDLVRAALDQLEDGSEAVMVGDTTWDVEAAKRAGVETIGVLSGGFGKAELEAAGAIVVFESVRELAASLDDTPFGRD